MVSGFIAKGVRRIILRANEPRERLDATLVPILCATSTYLVYVIGAVIVLDILGVNTASIIALLGAAGLEVLKKIIATEPRFLPDPAPQTMVVAMADSSVNLQLRGWTTIDKKSLRLSKNDYHESLSQKYSYFVGDF